jgi:hypothetical protein
MALLKATAELLSREGKPGGGTVSTPVEMLIHRILRLFPRIDGWMPKLPIPNEHRQISVHESLSPFDLELLNLTKTLGSPAKIHDAV